MLDKSTKLLTIGRAEDTTLSWRVKVAGTATAPSPSEFVFYVKGKPLLTQVAKADPGDPTKLFLVFDETYASALGTTTRDYQLIRTVNGSSKEFLAGQIVTKGFAV